MSNEAYDVVIVGAGPAGSSLGIQLASLGHKVLLLEKKTMPRDKLCGEFLSTEVGRMCRRLGVFERMQAAGAEQITRAVCTTPQGEELGVDLPGTGLGLSRRAFDSLLFERAGEAGAETRDGVGVHSIEGSLKDGFRVASSTQTIEARVVVGAYGRRAVLDRKLSRRSLAESSPYVAFKAHFSGRLPNDLIELHTFRGGYCGLLLEEEGLVNVCWVVRQPLLKAAGGSPESLLQQMRTWNGRLASRLEDMERVQAYLAAGQLSFRRKEVFAQDVCMIGDAAGMIAPLCGDGMGMALRSAELASGLIDHFVAGRCDDRAFKKRYASTWSREFARRMGMGRFLHAAFVHPWMLSMGFQLSRLFPELPRSLVSATRG